VKARVAKRYEAWQLIAWVGGVVAGLLILYGLTEGAPTAWIGIITPLMTVAGTLSGVFLGSRLSQRQRREEENRRRRALATMLLHELQFLKRVLTDIRNSPAPGGEKEIALSQTAVYNQAGVNLVLQWQLCD